MLYKSFFLSALTLLGSVAASNVLDITPSNFEDKLLSGTPALVEFFAPWCGHCKKLAPVYEELADGFVSQSSKVLIAKVDGDAHKELSSKFGIQGFPTIKWFDGKSDKPEDYQGGRDLEALQEFVAQKTGAKVKKAAKAPSSVQLLTDSTFSKAIGGTKGVFVAFTAPWCGHCKSLKPTWEQLATDFVPEEDVLIAQVDAEANKKVAETYGITGFPTIKFFPKGSSTPLDYSGGRDENSLVEYVNEQAGTHRVAGGGLDIFAGTIESLDILIEKMNGGSANIETISKDVKEAVASLANKATSGKYADYYIKVLDKLAGNTGYVEKELKRLEGLLKKGGLARNKIDDLASRVNILKKFGLTSEKTEL